LWPHARPARLRPKPVCDKHGLPPNTKKQEKNNSKPKHSFLLNDEKVEKIAAPDFNWCKTVEFFARKVDV